MLWARLHYFPSHHNGFRIFTHLLLLLQGYSQIHIRTHHFIALPLLVAFHSSSLILWCFTFPLCPRAFLLPVMQRKAKEKRELKLRMWQTEQVLPVAGECAAHTLPVITWRWIANVTQPIHDNVSASCNMGSTSKHVRMSISLFD